MCPEAWKNLQRRWTFSPWKSTDRTLTMKPHDSHIHDTASMTLFRCELDPVKDRSHIVPLPLRPLEA